MLRQITWSCFESNTKITIQDVLKQYLLPNYNK